jgi:hypothetical protein
MYLGTFAIYALEFRSATDTLGCWQALTTHESYVPNQPSSDTVSRFRPFVRRRLRTILPFFVAIRTLKPWVFFRRRVLGWYVRFPFMISYCTRFCSPQTDP